MKKAKFLFGFVVLLLFFFDFVYAFDVDWWRRVNCVTPKTTLNVYVRASKESDILETCCRGEKLEVSYGKERLIFIGEVLKKERWFEVVVNKNSDFLYGWVMESEIDFCRKDY